MKKRLIYVSLFLLCLGPVAFCQVFEIPEGEKYQKVKFELINNLMVVPVEVNGVELSFILDSGVSNPILFNLSDKDSVQINNVSEITLKGLGEGEPIKALKSVGNTFKMGKAVNQDQPLYVVLDKDLNFSTSLGIPVHGILGYHIFRDCVVEINYVNKTMKLHDPGLYKYKGSKRSQTLPLDIINRKAYIDAAVLVKDEKEVPVKLLVDTGSSDAVWLFQDPEQGIDIPEKNYEDYLGKGLNGHIFGKRTKVNGVRIGSFTLKDAKAAFPYMESFGAIKNLGDRNGSVGAEILKRFNLIIDYSRNKITLKKNGNFKAPFQYNLAGVELQHNGVRYIAERITDSRGVVHSDENPIGSVQILFEDRTRLSLVPEIVVSAIRAGSPAEEAGLKQGDVILAVNGKRVHRYKLQEVLKMMNEKEGKRIRVLIERSNKDLTFSFVLKKLF
ncbi:aspartyl protease family protein [Flagellimonas lutaonensis]|uniref:Aspartate aminotransferase n=1 Tax=Flagellimonas lutaonensis TaxID=516051 RepID=A0A0D5YU72_9FLAO|nr:aspartyl protease family protein [Allomuricauda lutaonensis]AKA35780.1 Aspartate aminotransferase [Allomuricauda lutaonensis]